MFQSDFLFFSPTPKLNNMMIHISPYFLAASRPADDHSTSPLLHFQTLSPALYRFCRLKSPPTSFGHPLTHRVDRFSPSQADVAVFKALSAAPEAAKYPHAARWYKHVASYHDDFAALPGDAAKPYTVYGPDVVAATLNPAKAPATEEDDDEIDLFGSDEEEDAQAVQIREERLAEYHKKKEAKPKVAAKSVVILDVKPWGTLRLDLHFGWIFLLIMTP